MEDKFLMKKEKNKMLNKVMISKNCQINKNENKCSKSSASFAKTQNVLIIVKVFVKELFIFNVESEYKNKQLHHFSK
jgi:hypothetical protein